ncbi:hypothetical protein LJC27_03655 [Christensenellaceae bacterium OttesenSCG-928-M15]|nr:hypothetical protein [Christensenellaceae bacterium OttesenSCG-928-M15]
MNRSKKYGGKLGAALKIGEAVKGTYFYPDLDPGDKAEDAQALLKCGYRMTGIHYSFRAAMYAMLDTGRHVYESKTNDYVMTHYDYTGYHFYYSPMTCFLSDGEWMEREKRYTDNPEQALATRKHKGFCGPTDKLTPDK